MKFIRTREHERTAKKKHTQPAIPVEFRKKLLTASKPKPDPEEEQKNDYAVNQVEETAVQITEDAVHSVSTAAKAVQPIIREKIVNTGIKERLSEAVTIHHGRDVSASSASTEIQQEKQTLQNEHYGQTKAPATKQNAVSPKDKPTAGASVPKTKPTTKKAAKPIPTASQTTQPKPLFRRSVDTVSSAIKQTGEAVARAGKSMISSLAGIAGGGVLLIALCVILLLATVLASPMGILYADQVQEPGTILLNMAIAQINAEYAAELEQLQEGEYSGIEIHGAPPDWREVVAVFASKTAGANDGQDVLLLDAEKVERLRKVFWDMTAIRAEEEEDILHIYIEAKTVDDMRLAYLFSGYQNQALDILLEELDSISAVMGDLSISQEDAIALLQNLPDDLDATRKAVIEHALSLVGKVNYFWGGKSLVLGWDSRWGTTMQVTAEGSSTTGTYRPFGLDCSGFVDWAFYNATDGTFLVGDGGGTVMQHDNCREISWSEAQPGDLVFYADDSHVGIVGGWDEQGNILVIHCSGSHNNVVITGAAGFSVLARVQY